jgi:hypothetical protein
MKEIASVIALVLTNTKGGVVQKGPNAGKPSKIQYEIDTAILQQAKQRVAKLLQQFGVYPELDLQFLMQQFIR